MNGIDLKKSTSPAQHTRAGHHVVVRVVGAEEHVVCITCGNIILSHKMIQV